MSGQGLGRENGLEGQICLSKCRFWGGCHHLNRGVNFFLFETVTKIGREIDFRDESGLEV